MVSGLNRVFLILNLVFEVLQKIADLLPVVG